MDVLPSMLVKVVLKVPSSVALMLFPCSASMSMRLVFASDVSSLIFSICSERFVSWSWFWTGVVIVGVVWTPLFRLLLKFARLDMMALGIGLMIDGVVSGSRG